MSQGQEQIQTIDPSFRISLTHLNRTPNRIIYYKDLYGAACGCILYTSIPSPAAHVFRRDSFDCETNHQPHDGSKLIPTRTPTSTEQHRAGTQRNPNLTLRTTHTLSLSLAIRAVNAIELCFVDCHRLLSSAERTVEKATCADVRPQRPDQKIERKWQGGSPQSSPWVRARQIPVPHPTRIDEDGSRHAAVAKTVTLLPSTHRLLRWETRRSGGKYWIYSRKKKTNSTTSIILPSWFS